MPSSIHPKVSATVVAGALTGLVLSELARRGVQVMPVEASDITVLISALAGYFMPSGESPSVSTNSKPGV